MSKTPDLLTQLEQLHDPKLDAFRAAVSTMRTSELLRYLISSTALIDVLDQGPTVEFANTIEQNVMRVAAASLAIENEIDRRIPKLER